MRIMEDTALVCFLVVPGVSLLGCPRCSEGQLVLKDKCLQQIVLAST